MAILDANAERRMSVCRWDSAPWAPSRCHTGTYSTGGASRCVTQAWELHPAADSVVAWGEGFSEPCAEGQVLQRVGLTSHPWPQGELGCRWNGPRLTSLSCFLPALPAGKLGRRWPACGSESKAPSRLVSKTSLENVQGRLLFLQASFCQTQIVSSGKMLGLTNKGKEPQRKVDCCSGPLLRRARGCVSSQEDQERLACADPLGPGGGGAWCFLTLGNEVTQLSPLPYLSSAPVTPGSSSAAGWTLEPRAQNPTPMHLQPSYGTCAILG